MKLIQFTIEKHGKVEINKDSVAFFYTPLNSDYTIICFNGGGDITVNENIEVVRKLLTED